jgi:hypothetical protein
VEDEAETDFVWELGVGTDAAVGGEAARGGEGEYEDREKGRKEGDIRLFGVVVTGENSHVGTGDAHKTCDEKNSQSLDELMEKSRKASRHSFCKSTLRSCTTGRTSIRNRVHRRVEKRNSRTVRVEVDTVKSVRLAAMLVHVYAVRATISTGINMRT